MDRPIIYPAAIPQASDLLTVAQSAMIGLGYLTEAVMGSGTVAAGLSCTATNPASMTVNIAPGSVMQLAQVDTTAYSTLPSNSNSLMQQGIVQTTTPFTLTAPATSGQSINYLIQAAFSQQDGNATVLPYYNASSPSNPYSGPNNSGTAQNTMRYGNCVLELKAGAPAATGSQTTPAVDSGYVGLWVITVAYGQTTVTASNIAQYSGAPFLPYTLPQLSSAQAAAGSYAALNGSSTEQFNVANATTNSNAVALGQIAGLTTGRLLNVQTFYGSGTYTPTSGTTSVIVEVQGGGGAGGGAGVTTSSQQSYSAGGSAGTYAQARIASGFSGAAVTVGAAGTGAAAASGTNGGASSFGSLVSCPGGNGGAYVGANAPGGVTGATVSPAAATVGTGASLIRQTVGGAGGQGLGFNVNLTPMGGPGGNSQMGAGAAGNGVAGTGYGAGGSGAFSPASQPTAIAGGNGSPGIVIVYEFS